MTKIIVRPAWRFETEAGEKVDPLLFSLLRAIHDTGVLKLAAEETKVSYRHAWDLLKHSSVLLGSPLVQMERGKGAKLTTLGEKLLWAEQRSDASLFPQLDNVASELSLEIGRARKQAQTVIRIHASHGYTVEKLPQLMANHGHADVDLQYMGSVDALASLQRSNCDLAGFHVPLGEIGGDLWEHYAKWLKPRQQKIIRLVIRTQGLIVAAGNPKKIRGLKDLCRPGLRFVNRQRMSGTRILLDGLLRLQSIDPARITGYGGGEFTHAAVAAFVASGMADAAFGVEPAARQFKLDFLPIAKERYMLACRNDSLRQAPIQEMIGLLKGPEFERIMRPVPGYTLDEPGGNIEIKNIFP
ncbi:MAG TPA: substrate-binding domain-containing protein [Burkholderiales bacterium]|nr:substrate-binding domain-containing protein [Burkholderiales bacterium]